MRLYYQKDVLTFMCFCNEMFYSGLYLLHFTNGPTCKLIATQILKCHFKNVRKLTTIKIPFIVISVLGISIFKVLTVIAFPVAIAKSGISLLHAYVAAQNIAIIDSNEREEARKRNSAKKPE